MTDYTQLAKEWLRKYDDLYDPQVNDLAALLSEAVAEAERDATSCDVDECPCECHQRAWDKYARATEEQS